MWLSEVKRSRESCWILLRVFCGMQFFIKHSIFRKGRFPFTSSISILSVSSFKDRRSLGEEGWGIAGVAAILMKRLDALLKKRFKNRKKERRTYPSQKVFLQNSHIVLNHYSHILYFLPVPTMFIFQCHVFIAFCAINASSQIMAKGLFLNTWEGRRDKRGVSTASVLEILLLIFLNWRGFFELIFYRWQL